MNTTPMGLDPQQKDDLVTYIFIGLITALSFLLYGIAHYQ